MEKEEPTTMEEPLLPVVKTPDWRIAAVAATVMGACFGTAFYKSHVFEPQLIRAQFLFGRFVMLKMFLAAMGTGALWLSLLSVATPSTFDHVRNFWAGVALSRNWLYGSCLGAAILGAGMAIGGACPGMVLAQVGAGVSYSLVTVLGGLLACLVFGIFEAEINTYVLQRGPSCLTSQVYADKWLTVCYWKCSMALGVCCQLFALVLEVVFPWQLELPQRLQPQLQDCVWWQCVAWPPTIAGILLGSMQLPALLLCHTLLGSATSYQVMVSCPLAVCSQPTQKKYSYMAMFSNPKVATWWQLPYVGVAMLASFFWAAAGDDFQKAPGVGLASAFLGGFLMLFGSRLAAGCTSGHGISGCAILMLHSFAAVPCMFASGILVAVLWQCSAGSFYSVE